jgi:hypothetical protein
MRKSAAFDSAEFVAIGLADATGVGVAVDCGADAQPAIAIATSTTRAFKAPPS